MNKRLCIAISILALAVCLGFVGTSARAESGKNPNNWADVEFNGPISKIDYVHRTMNVKDIEVHAVSNMMLKGGKSINTVFLDENGKPIPFTAFKINGQWAKVTGYQTNDGFVVAKKIERQFNQSVDNLMPGALPEKLVGLITHDDQRGLPDN